MRVLKSVFTTTMVLAAFAIADNVKTEDVSNAVTKEVAPGVTITNLNPVEPTAAELLLEEILKAKSEGRFDADLWNRYENLTGGRNEFVETLDEGTEACPGTDLGSATGVNVANGTTVEHANDFDDYNSEPACWPGQWYEASNRGPDVAYKWTAPATAGYTFSLCGSGYDSGISLWQYTCADHQPSYPTNFICGNDDACGSNGLRSKLECIPLQQGQQILIVIDGYNTLAGSYVLDILPCVVPCSEPELCGEPAEHEPNNQCGSTIVDLLECDDVLYGYFCSETNDVDYVRVIVPPYTRFRIWIADGEDCDDTPSNDVKFRLYNVNCGEASSSTRESIIIYNDSDNNLIYYARVYANGEHPDATSWALHTECCELTNYCEHPIEVPSGEFNEGTYRFEWDGSTCCATDEVDCIHPEGCGSSDLSEDPCYNSGSDVIFKIVLSQAGTINIVVSGPLDIQVMVFTDCDNPGESCIESADQWDANHSESILNLYLNPGTYYVSVSQYSQNGAACGEIDLVIESDVPLPAELIGFDAIAGDGEVTLNWTTASETNNDYFDLLRNGNLCTRIEATNSATGSNYSFTDEDLTNGQNYNYSLVAVDLTGNREEIGTTQATPNFNSATVTEYALHQNYPNPFNPSTTITFDLVETSDVVVTVYNVLGEVIAVPVSGHLSAGRHTTNFDATGLSSGVYLYRIQAGEFVAQKKMLLLK